MLPYQAERLLNSPSRPPDHRDIVSLLIVTGLIAMAAIGVAGSSDLKVADATPYISIAQRVPDMRGAALHTTRLQQCAEKRSVTEFSSGAGRPDLRRFLKETEYVPLV